MGILKELPQSRLFSGNHFELPVIFSVSDKQLSAGQSPSIPLLFGGSALGQELQKVPSQPVSVFRVELMHLVQQLVSDGTVQMFSCQFQLGVVGLDLDLVSVLP